MKVWQFNKLRFRIWEQKLNWEGRRLGGSPIGAPGDSSTGNLQGSLGAPTRPCKTDSAAPP